MRRIAAILFLLIFISGCAAPDVTSQVESIYNSEELNELQADIEAGLLDYVPASYVLVLEGEDGDINVSVFVPHTSELGFFGFYVKWVIETCKELNFKLGRLIVCRSNDRDDVDFIFSTSTLDGVGHLADYRSGDGKLHFIGSYDDLRELFPLMEIIEEGLE